MKMVNSIDEEPGGLSRVKVLYDMMVEEVVIGQVAVANELEKPAGEQDVGFIMGQVEINQALNHAVDVLENSGLIDEDDLLCRLCAAPCNEHDEQHEMKPPIKVNKPN